MAKFLVILAIVQWRTSKNTDFRASGYNFDKLAGFSDPDFL